MYRLAHDFATLPENSALCQGDRERELIPRPELRQTDRHADEAKTDATETAVTGHLVRALFGGDDVTGRQPGCGRDFAR